MKKLKKTLLSIAVVILLSAVTTCVFASDVKLNNDIKVTFNGQLLTFDQPPVIENGRTLVPFRGICEAMDAEVGWNEDNQQVTATLGDTTLEFIINEPFVYVNGIKKAIDQAPVIINSRTLLPARAFAEELGAIVDWDNDTKTVIITKSNDNEESVLKKLDYDFLAEPDVPLEDSEIEEVTNILEQKFGKADEQTGYLYIFEVISLNRYDNTTYYACRWRWLVGGHSSLIANLLVNPETKEVFENSGREIFEEIDELY